jgi:Bardet-Biedl syndrome 7 protein
MGLVKLTATEPSYRWDMLNEKKLGSISCLATSDLTGNGLDEILVGRDDGVVEVYGLDESMEPRLRFTHVRNKLHLGTP